MIQLLIDPLTPLAREETRHPIPGPATIPGLDTLKNLNKKNLVGGRVIVADAIYPYIAAQPIIHRQHESFKHGDGLGDI
ncbi:MAG: hypothetical protein V1255_07360, partial [Alphaproteobacteria bacterium]|nr:hypothetical protein [Alphaproteobacteria bacterium]